ncbi:MAG: alpha-L-rhamnosidase [Alistipes sp.]|nr:alpha-L-rhamnosidase [Alistipes sp.]
MKKLTTLLVLCILFPAAIFALPPIFGSEYDGKTEEDPLDRLYITPQRIVWMNDGDGRLIKDLEILLRPGNGQADMARTTPYCRMYSTNHEKAAIILDFGKELHGGLQMVMGGSSNRAPSLVRIRFGESVGEVCSQTYNLDWRMGFSTDDHAKRDIVVEIPRSGNFEIGNTGFRFVRIDLLENDHNISLKEVRAILRYRDIPYIGSFNSSDERLNQIWMTGAWTVHLNMQEFLWDGIKRDRCVWLGDMHPEVATISHVFGDNQIVPASLDLAAEQFPLPGWMNGMSAYSLWYLVIHHDWYMHHGDMNFLNKHRDYIVGLIDQIVSKIDEEGNEELSPMRFLDWPSSPNREGVEAGYRGLMAWALNSAEKLCIDLGEPAAAEQCRTGIERLQRKYVDHNQLKQGASLMAIGGLMDPVQACNDVVSVGGAKDFSTFYGYYMLQAQAMAGEYQTALDIIRQYWGGMLDMGATSFWEDFNLEWMENSTRLDEIPVEGMNDIHGSFGDYCYPSFRHSFCHGWSSGPTAWMSEHVLGVEILEPGCRTVRINPHMGDLEWVEGTFPTPYGEIKIRHDRRPDGTVVSKVDAPRGVKIVK